MRQLTQSAKSLTILLTMGVFVAHSLSALEIDVHAASPIDRASWLIVRVKRGTALIGLNPVRVNFYIHGDDRPDFRMRAHDGHWSFFDPDCVNLDFIANGSDTIAEIGIGTGFSLLALGGGVVAVELSVPISWRGILSVSSFDGDITIRDLVLEECTVDHDRGFVRMERVEATQFAASLLDSASEFEDVAAGRGIVSSRLGRFDARRMSGSWDIKGKDGSINFEAGEGLVGIRIGTRLGNVRLSFPTRSAFSFIATAGELGRVRSKWPLKQDEGRIKRFRYSQGVGGADALVETRDGLVTLEAL